MSAQDGSHPKQPPSNWEQEFLDQDDAHVRAVTLRYRCPECDSLLVLKEGANGSFWGCEAFPICDYTANNQEGKPVRPIRYL